MKNFRGGNKAVAWGIVFALVSGIGSAAAQSPSPVPPVSPSAAPAVAPVQRVFAYVDEQPLYASDLHTAFSQLLRNKFYHGQVPEGQMQVVMKEAQDSVIEAYLLHRETERRQVAVDAEKIDAELAKYDQRYQNSPQWQQSKEKMLPGLRAELERRARREALERGVRDVPAPTGAEVEAFYKANPQLFTEPERLRMRSILLAVDPGAPQQAWDAAQAEAAAIVRRLRDGADFAEQARIASNDATAESGGDMGYVHRGMLADVLQERIDSFKLGEVSDPVTLLQGVGIFRIEERVPARLRDFESVRQRAQELLVRANQDKAWATFLADLKNQAKIRILTAATEGAATQ